MRVIVPHTPARDDVRLQVEEALWRADAAAGTVDAIEWWDVSRSDTAYAELLCELWAAGESFCLVEHDVVIHERVLAEFEQCDRGYCAFPYPLRDYVGPALGCTRLSAGLLAAVPDAAERAAAIPSNYGATGHWRQLDIALLRNVLRDEHGLQPHVHWPPVEHLRPGYEAGPGTPLRGRIIGPGLARV